MTRAARFPLYIPSKGRAYLPVRNPASSTIITLGLMNQPFRVVVEEDEFDEYAKVVDSSNLLILDPEYKRSYETCDDLGTTISTGSGPARNFIWDHSIAEGHDYHWIMDDNIKVFYRIHQNRAIPVGDGSIFHAMETFVTRYQNVGMAGPQYKMFIPVRTKYAPFVIGHRIYSCNLIRNDVPFRWRGRYNEDTILSLDMLKAGWNTVLFYAYAQDKSVTQSLPGGNTDELYKAHGTLVKSQMLVDQHPDVARLAWRFGRWHHYVDYRQFEYLPLIKRADYDPASEPQYRWAETDRSRPWRE